MLFDAIGIELKL